MRTNVLQCTTMYYCFVAEQNNAPVCMYGYRLFKQ